MATTARYTTTFDHQIDVVWSMIRDFNNDPAYIEGITESEIENGKRGDDGRRHPPLQLRRNWIRQSLEAFSDLEHSFTYAGVEPFEHPEENGAERPSPANYQGTIRLRPADGSTLMEWSVTLEAEAGDEAAWRSLLETLIPIWADSLRRTLDGTRIGSTTGGAARQ